MKFSKVAIDGYGSAEPVAASRDFENHKEKSKLPLVAGVLFYVAVILALILRPAKDKPEIQAREESKESATPKRSQTIQLLRDIHEFQNELKEEADTIE